jgi:hypothetical protein
LPGIELFFQFLVVHAILDFVLQPSVMASAKCRRSKHHKNGNRDFPAWYYWLGTHSLAHGGGVYLVSGSLWLGLLEAFLHGLIDYLKCEDVTSMDQDQALHVACKIGYCLWLLN